MLARGVPATTLRTSCSFREGGGDAVRDRDLSLRNIALTAPYFHNGKVKTLEEAVRVMAPSQLNKNLLDEQARDVAAFLDALTGPFPEQTMPRLPATIGYTILD